MNAPRPNAERLRFSSTVYLFYEGLTELRYLQDISAGNLVHIVKGGQNAAPVKLIEMAVRFVRKEGKRILRTIQDPHIWIVFDDDEKPDIRGAAEWFAHHSASIPDTFRERVHVGYMKPCIELWGMLCHPKGKKAFRRALTHTAMQRELHRIMPTYEHEGNPFFDVAAMIEIPFATKMAKNWERTFGPFPMCTGATFFAGIYPLVESIAGSSPELKEGKHESS